MTIVLCMSGGRPSAERSRASMVRYEVNDVSPDMSFLEMLDVLNEELIEKGEEPIAFDHDCREGICGTCGFMINGVAHGPMPRTTRLPAAHAPLQGRRRTLPRALARPGLPRDRDLVVDRGAFDRIIAAGGFVSVTPAARPTATPSWSPRTTPERAMDAAACIGCGACVAACPNASASLFIARQDLAPGAAAAGPARARLARAATWWRQMDQEGFGSCTNIGECEAVCPKAIQLEFIARMNRDYIKAAWTHRGDAARSEGA